MALGGGPGAWALWTSGDTGHVVAAGFGLVALALAAVGLYGVVTPTVREETHAIGVRMMPSRQVLQPLAGSSRVDVGELAGRVPG